MNSRTTRHTSVWLRAGLLVLLLVMGLVACSLSPSPDLPSASNLGEMAGGDSPTDVAQGTGGTVDASADPLMGGGGMGGETEP